MHPLDLGFLNTNPLKPQQYYLSLEQDHTYIFVYGSSHDYYLTKIGALESIDGYNPDDFLESLDTFLAALLLREKEGFSPGMYLPLVAYVKDLIRQKKIDNLLT